MLGLPESTKAQKSNDTSSLIPVTLRRERGASPCCPAWRGGLCVSRQGCNVSAMNPQRPYTCVSTARRCTGIALACAGWRQARDLGREQPACQPDKIDKSMKFQASIRLPTTLHAFGLW